MVMKTHKSIFTVRMCISAFVSLVFVHIKT